MSENAISLDALTALQKDKARLDWLDAQGRVCEGCGLEDELADSTSWYLLSDCVSLREAIDLKISEEFK